MNRVLFVASMAALMIVPTALALDLESPVPASRWIVGFYAMPDLKEGDLYQGARVVGVTPELAFATVETTSFDLFQARANLDDNVRYVETDVSSHHIDFTPNDFYWTHSSNWGVKKINAMSAWDRTLGATSIKDGHIDSGVVAGHEDLPSSRFTGGWDFYSNDATPDDSSGCSWHGSHTSGTVGATINNGKGFAGLAQIVVMPIKIFGGGNCFATSTTGIANAIKYAGDQGAHISSNSWGGGAFSTAINDAITYSLNKGVIFVAASGNGGCSNCVGQPWVGRSADVIIVTATDSNDAGASFNSKGPQVTVSAPGVSIGSSGGPGSSYYIMSGTSMATPHVAGTAALIKTLHPTWTRTDVRNRLISTAVDLGPAGKDDTFGYGRINAGAAVV